MVFEAVVVDILNRVLGEYVENLDSSQLKIGIWGGDVVLKDLAIKASAFSELNLPVKVTWGQLGRLVLKIPWRNIYKEPVIVNIEDLLVLVSPESDIVYLPETEEKLIQDAKQAELARVEEAKRRAAAKDAINADDSFVEKLTTQIIKNVQVSVERIHLRYEDKTTRQGQGAFCLGATMNKLSMQTTDEKGKPLLNSVAQFIYKALTLDGLALYWNTTGQLFSDLSVADRIKSFKSDIPTANSHPSGYSYVFGPLSSAASLVMNPKPETDGTNYTTPKIELNINMKEFNVALTRRQFQDMMLLVENMDRLSKGRQFKKFRPSVASVHGHAAIWWKFAYECVTSEIKRRRNEWTWAYIMTHRQLCRDYLECYTRVLGPKPPTDAVARARDLEARLDVLNLVMLRERAALEAQRQAAAEEKAKAERGWFSGWLWSEPTAPQRFSVDIAKKVENVMTPEEKAKLYSAIDYQENATPTMYPTTFVATKMKFLLSLVRVTVMDEGVCVLNAELKDLDAQLEQRPAANALRTAVTFGRFTVDGLKQKEGTARLVSSNYTGNEHLIIAEYETNPPDGKCDQRITLNARPLRVIYNHETISLLQDIFASADSTGINQVKARTAASLPTFKQVSAIGLEFAIEKRSRIDLQVDVSASTVFVPYRGVFVKDCDMLVLQLGQLFVTTDEQKTTSDLSVRMLTQQGSSEDEKFHSILLESYTKFHCQLSGIQILMKVKGENWEQALEAATETPLHILQPTRLEVVIKKSLVTDDASIPKIIVEGVLPSICIQVSEQRVLALASLAFSMEGDQPPLTESQSRSSSTWSLASLSSHLEQKRKESAVVSSNEATPLVQGTDLMCTFKMHEFAVNVLKKNGRFLRLAALQLNLSFVQRTLDTVLDVKLSDVEMIQRYQDSDLPVLSSAGSPGECLVSLNVVMCARNSPELFTTKGGVLVAVKLVLSQTNIVLHQAALKSLIDFGNNLSAQVDEVKRAKFGREVDAGPVLRDKKMSRRLSLIMEEDGQKPASASKIKRRPRKTRVEVIDMKAEVIVEKVGVEVRASSPIAKLAVEGIRAGVVNKRSSSTYNVVLQGLKVTDLDTETAYSVVVWTADKEAVYANVTMYNKDVYQPVDDKLDMRVDAKLGQLKLVFLQQFLQRLLAFLNAFQTAKEAVIEASAAAAERAKQNVIKAYDDATRIALNVNLKAPVIVVPRNCKSDNALIIDLGTVSIRNRFEDLSRVAEGTPVRDVMSLDLHELKLLRGSVRPSDLKILLEYPLLDPVTFDLEVKRNLSAGWYTKIPDMEVSSHLGSIQVDLDQMDYAFIMAVLQENLSEGGSDKVETKRTSAANTSVDRETGVAVPSVSTAILLSFAMDSFTISLHNGGLKTLTGDVNPASKRSALAKFVIERLSLAGKIFSDGSIFTSVKLADCVLTDNRMNSNSRVTTLMERKRDEANLQSMIEVTYQQKDIQKLVDAKVSGFILVLSMEFLLQVGEFFAVDKNLEDAPVIEDARHVRYGRSVKVRSTSTVAAPVLPEEPDPDASLRIDLLIERPDIILVENMDDLDTDAIVFHTRVVMNYRTNGARQYVNGTINELQLYSCCFNPAKRKTTMKEVLKPVTVSLTGSTPENRGLHINLHCTPIVIAVSPSTIQLLSQCYATLNNSSASSREQLEPDWSQVWMKKKFNDHQYWFLLPDEALDALEIPEVLTVAHRLQELCIIEVPRILITVETGVGLNTVPMILMEMGLSGQAKNWSYGLQLESNLSFGMQYYNTELSLWEPLVEPIKEQRGRQVEFKPWQLNCQVSINKEEEPVAGDLTPGMEVVLSSRDSLEVTVSRTCLDVLTQLGASFADAVATEHLPQPPALPVGTYIIKNNLGVDATLLLNDSQLRENTVKGKSSDIVLKDSDQVNCELRTDDGLATAAPGRITYSPSSPSRKMAGCFLPIRIDKLGGAVVGIPLDRACKRLFPIKIGDKSCSIVAEIACGPNSTTLTLRSTVQVYNHFSVALHCGYMKDSSAGTEFISWKVEPQTALNLPLYAVDTTSGELFFTVDGYKTSIVPYKWKELVAEPNLAETLTCQSKKEEDVDPFYIKAVGEVEHVYLESSSRHTLASLCFNIHLQPTVELVNNLPVTLTLAAQGSVSEMDIKPGSRAQVPHAVPGMSYITLRISDYLDKEWSCRCDIPETVPSEFVVWPFESFDSAEPVTLNLGAHVSLNRGTLEFSIHARFWMINKTGLYLSYKLDDGSPVYHPEGYSEPIMLSPSSRKFLGKKKAQVRVKQGVWSDKFSLDVAGSSGLVECKTSLDSSANSNMISVAVKLTDSGLTKMIILTPAYVVVNETNAVLELQEVGSVDWFSVQPKDCSPLWPKTDKKSRMVLRVSGTDEVSPPFHFHSTHSCLLQLSNQYGGILVDVQSTAGGIYITLFSYKPGLAPALIINHCNEPVTVHEKDMDDRLVLEPRNQVMYAWQQPSGHRTLIWVTGSSNVEFSLNEDTVGQVKKKDIWYVSFLDGLQRVLLITADPRVAEAVQSAGSLRPLSKINLSLSGMGLSLVNNRIQNSTELLYMGLVSSGVIWECRKLNSSRFKPLPTEVSAEIERAHQKYMDEESRGRTPDPMFVIDNKTQVNLETLEIVHPNKRILRRSFHPALWIELAQTEHTSLTHLKINRLQLDNQLPSVIFPVILAPVPPPKTVAAGQGPKPFVELSILKRVTPQSAVQQFKYFQALVQEFHVKLDIGFVKALLAFLEADETPESVVKQRFLADLQLSKQPLLDHIAVISSQEHKDFYDLLHFSPLKIHLSFSMAGNLESKSLPAAFNLLLQSLGVTLTDIQDAVFKLSCMERKNIFLTQSQLIGEATTHYTGQALRQVYVLLLGLDVIGNPYGLVTGIGEGVEAFFYEPFQGMIQGPSEFAEGLGLGVKSLFGHTVGGAAGAAGRITGTLGKGLAALSMDKEYQQQRLEQQQRRHGNLQSSMAEGGKGLLMGVVHGVTGVVTKPIAGAKEEGASGFFKGVGKGVVGLFTRPVSGVVDCVSTSLNVVKRATEQGSEATRLRQPRLLKGAAVPPYDADAANGCALLAELDNKKFAMTDEYEYHVGLPSGDVLLLTDRRIITATIGVVNTWQVTDSILWQELAEPPAMNPRGVLLTLEKKKTASIMASFSQGREQKLIAVANAEELQFLMKKMLALYFEEKAQTRR